MDLGGGSFVVPLFYADSTANPNGLECDSDVITKDGKQIGLTGSCGATAFETPQFEVACVGVTIYNGKYILKEEDLGVTPDVAKVSFDVKDSQGQLYSYWTGERTASIIQFQELKNIDFVSQHALLIANSDLNHTQKSSLMSKHRPYEAVNGGVSYVPGIDMTVHCPDPKVNPSRDS